MDVAFVALLFCLSIHVLYNEKKDCALNNNFLVHRLIAIMTHTTLHHQVGHSRKQQYHQNICSSLP